MSWLFSRALVEEYSGHSYWAGEPCVQLNLMDTPQPFLRNGKTMDFSKLSQFGATSQPLTVARGEALLMWYRAGFRARTSAQPDPGEASTVLDQDSGSKCSESRKKSCPDTCSSKIALCCGREGWKSYCKGLPMQGSMQDGELSRLPTLGLPILEKESGLWPTPNVPNGGRRVPKDAEVRTGQTPTAYHKGKKVQVVLEQAVQWWPTPRATEGSKGGPNQRGSKRDWMLPSAVHRFPTPTQWDWRSGKASQATMERNARPLNEQIGGSLSPTWVEWLMGWPLGWTDLKPLAMDKFRQWLQQHGGF